MFGKRFFGQRYFGTHFFPGAGTPGVCATAPEIWDYVLGNGLSSGQTLVAIHAAVGTLLVRDCFDEIIQGVFTAKDILRLLGAVAAGTTTIDPQSGGGATVVFSALDQSGPALVAQMRGSERIDVTLTP